MNIKNKINMDYRACVYVAVPGYSVWTGLHDFSCVKPSMLQELLQSL